jgi:transcriptional regulator of acetoin/glycerol metabolism
VGPVPGRGAGPGRRTRWKHRWGDDLPFKEAKARWVAQFDVDYLTRLLERCQDNVAEASRRSGIDRVHLFRLIKKYGLRRA